MFCLVDCNNFFVSCERIFRPDLENKPVMVLSNNDGCVISRSNEVKKLGIKMGIPLFKVKSLVEQGKVHVFSANFELYSDISCRIMESLKSFTENLQVYSIDEAFLDLSKTRLPLTHEGAKIHRTLRKHLSIPVSIGIASTKTLCKIAAFLAKQKNTAVIVLSSEDEIMAALAQVPVSEVWGVGLQLNAVLRYEGIDTALDLVRMNDCYVRQRYGIQLLRTLHELRGIRCSEIDNSYEPRKSIISSRSFGRKVTSFTELAEAVSTHISKSCAKLRSENLQAQSLSVYIRANRFTAAYFKGYKTFKLPYPTNDTRILIQNAEDILKKLFIPNLLYDKCGIELFDLSNQTSLQYNLFEKSFLPAEILRKENLFRCIDTLNKKDVNGKVFVAACGTTNNRIQQNSRSWQSKSNMKSACYTTNLSQLPFAFVIPCFAQ